jgi:hypothetical protein
LKAQPGRHRTAIVTITASRSRLDRPVAAIDFEPLWLKIEGIHIYLMV